MSLLNESAARDDDDDDVPENVTWSDDQPEPRLHVILIQFASILLLSVVCISGNVLLLTIVWKTRPLRTISNALIVNLCVADLLTSILVLPAFSASVFHPDAVSSQDSVCTVIGLVTQLLSMETMSTLGCIALDRYINICHPLRYPALVTKSKMALVVGMTWVQSSVLALLPVCGFGHYRFRSAILPLCSLDFLSNRAFSFLVLCVVIAPSFFVVAVCYGSILKAARIQAKKIFDLELMNARAQLSSWRTRGLPNGRVVIGRGIWRRRRRRRRSATANTVHPTDDAAAAAKAPADRARSPVEAWRSAAVRMMEDPESLWMRAVTKIRKSMKQVRAAKTVVIIIGGYVSCWVPYVVILIVTLVRQEYVTGYVINFVVTFLAFSSCFVDPLICIFVNRDFWAGFKAVLGLRRRALARRTAATVFAYSGSAASVVGGGGHKDKCSSPSTSSSDALQWNSFREKWNELRRTDTTSPGGVLEKTS